VTNDDLFFFTVKIGTSNLMKNHVEFLPLTYGLFIQVHQLKRYQLTLLCFILDSQLMIITFFIVTKIFFITPLTLKSIAQMSNRLEVI